MLRVSLIVLLFGPFIFVAGNAGGERNVPESNGQPWVSHEDLYIYFCYIFLVFLKYMG